MIGLLPCSYFMVATGAIASGKTSQVMRMLLAEVDGERICAPAVYGLAESSAEGTAGEALLDPERCLVWPVADCEDAQDMTRTCFPSSGPLTLGAARVALHKRQVDRAIADKRPPPPIPPTTRCDNLQLRACVVDTMTTLYKGSVSTARRKLKAEAEGKAGGGAGRAGKKGAEYNDDRHLHGYAARVAKDFIDGLNGITQHRGMVVLVTVHTGPAIESTIVQGEGGKSESIVQVVGECPELGSSKPVQAGLAVAGYSATWDALAAKANTIWHCYANVPDLSRATAQEVNAVAAAGGVRHGVITMRGIYKGLGKVLWAKRQGGEGPLGIFASVPAVWHPDVPNNLGDGYGSPDLGMVLAMAVKQYRDGKGA